MVIPGNELHFLHIFLFIKTTKKKKKKNIRKIVYHRKNSTCRKPLH